MADNQTTEDDEFLHGIWWVSDGERGLRNASPMECATEIKRLRAENAELLAAMNRWQARAYSF